MTTGAVQDIALDRYRTTIAGLPDYAAEVAPGVTGRAVLFERALLATPLFFPITLDRHAFRDAFQVDGLYLAEAYDAIFDPAYAAAIAGRRDALAAAPPGDADLFVLGGSTNHFHWLLDFLPRLALASTPRLPDMLVVHGEFASGQRESLAYASAGLGLPELPLKPVPDGVVGVRRARIPLAIGRDHTVAFWRRILAAHGERSLPRRRLFIRRGQVARRRLLDEDAVADRFAAAGFEVVDPGAMDFAGQRRLFAEAALVVGTHGAALANAVFMAPSATLVEIVGADAPTPFPALARAAGLRYGALRADVAGATATERLHADLRLPEGAVAALLARIGQEATA